MFTGIITDLGTVARVERKGGDARFVFSSAYDMATVDMGASIACNGVCLTVVEKGNESAGRGWFAVDASAETLSATTLGDWTEGKAVNFERALKVGDELGGHIVSGHVDGVATVVAVEPFGESVRYTFQAPESLKKYVAPKGSVALDGVSLTVNEVNDGAFGVNIIPHTQQETTFGGLKAGDRVNMEIDMLARYVARLMDKD